MHECKLCNYTTNVKSNFKKHLMMKHLKNLEKPIPSKEASTEKAKYFCEYCKKSFTRKDNLIRHNSNHCKKTVISINLQNQIDDLRNEIDKVKRCIQRHL